MLQIQEWSAVCLKRLGQGSFGQMDIRAIWKSNIGKTPHRLGGVRSGVSRCCGIRLIGMEPSWAHVDCAGLCLSCCCVMSSSLPVCALLSCLILFCLVLLSFCCLVLLSHCLILLCLLLSSFTVLSGFAVLSCLANLSHLLSCLILPSSLILLSCLTLLSCLVLL